MILKCSQITGDWNDFGISPEDARIWAKDLPGGINGVNDTTLIGETHNTIVASIKGIVTEDNQSYMQCRFPLIQAATLMQSSWEDHANRYFQIK